MATETLILRPVTIVQYTGVNSTLTSYPSDTAVREKYLLISEEFADDDASYIIFSSEPITAAGFAIPEKYIGKSPTNIKFYRRDKAEFDNIQCDTQVTTGYIEPKTTEESPCDILSGDNARISIFLSYPTTTEYNTVSAEVSSDDLSNLVFDSTVTHIFMTQKYSDASSSGSKNLNVRTTQMYIEVTYTDSDSEANSDTIYLKENGSWTSVPCMIYQKSNGTWTVTDSTIFENGDKFILQEIT